MKNDRFRKNTGNYNGRKQYGAGNEFTGAGKKFNYNKKTAPYDKPAVNFKAPATAARKTWPAAAKASTTERQQTPRTPRITERQQTPRITERQQSPLIQENTQTLQTPVISEVPDVPENVVAGRNPVLELIRSGRAVDKLFVAHRSGDAPVGSAAVIVAEAVARHIPVIEVEREKISRITGGMNHQGVAAIIPEREYASVDDMFEKAASLGEKPLIVIADGIEDPHNLGALIRVAEGAGAHGLIIPKRRSVGLTAVVSKTSAGAAEHLLIAKVTNLARTVDELKERGLWIFAAQADGTPYDECDYSLPCAIILGGEDSGVSRLLLDKSDFTAAIPMYGKVNSLNVSTASAVILYEAVRKRKRNK